MIRRSKSREKAEEPEGRERKGFRFGHGRFLAQARMGNMSFLVPGCRARRLVSLTRITLFYSHFAGGRKRMRGPWRVISGERRDANSVLPVDVQKLDKTHGQRNLLDLAVIEELANSDPFPGAWNCHPETHTNVQPQRQECSFSVIANPCVSIVGEAVELLPYRVS
jgi:hypothetical protein